MTAYYNENDPFAAQWLRNLIAAGLIAPGIVDERSIHEVTPGDLRGATQCHFFAGIGGWSHALRLAGWPDDEPVWTGSCPCQPFSVAGKQAGFADERHLWPVWYRLIRESRPGTIFGEQVDKALAWIDLVSGNLEDQEYAFAAAIMGAHSVSAPHIRQRLYCVANHHHSGRIEHPERDSEAQRETGPQRNDPGGRGGLCGMADSSSAGLEIERQQQARREREAIERGGAPVEFGDAMPAGRPEWRSLAGVGSTSSSSSTGIVGNASEPRSGRNARAVPRAQAGTEGEMRSELDQSQSASPWADCEWIWCRDGKYRPVEPGTFPLAHGVPNRVGQLRGYGNAIVPQVAAKFIEAYIDARKEN
ncbi:MAG: DNA cytosine methyltransferase [Patescibacteria group bacterium]|nr:DNA cytosine methyltransferase [Patescibacteria group bacterium]